MPALGDYSNVYDTALLVLQQKGFRLWYDDASALYWCERGGWDFVADSPTALLGLVAIFEYKQPAEYREYWWREQGEINHRDLSRSRPNYRAVFDRP